MGVGGMVMGHRVQHPVTSERAQQQLGKYWSHIYNGLLQLHLVYRQTPAQNDPREQNCDTEMVWQVKMEVEGCLWRHVRWAGEVGGSIRRPRMGMGPIVGARVKYFGPIVGARVNHIF